MKYAWIVAYIATIVGANWALRTYGIIDIGFGYSAPAGVLFAGLAFTARDMVHETAGRWWVLAAIAMGAGLSFLLEDAQKFAIASGMAFGLSELADMAVYSPLRERRWLMAVAASNVVGFTLDSFLFLWLAFGSVDFWQGQLLGKLYMTLIAVAALWAWRRRDLSQRAR